MMTCRDMIDFLMDYVEEQLSTAERRRFDEHLEACPECVDYVDSYRTMTGFGDLICAPENDETPPEMPEELVTAILEARRAEA